MAILGAIGTIIVGLVVLLVIGWLVESGIPQFLFALFVLGLVAYVVGSVVLGALF